jgi:hypothetical protein
MCLRLCNLLPHPPACPHLLRCWHVLPGHVLRSGAALGAVPRGIDPLVVFTAVWGTHSTSPTATRTQLTCARSLLLLAGMREPY